MTNPKPLRGKARPDFKPKYGPTCTVEDCGRKSHLRGLCGTHYRRWRTTGESGGPIADRQQNRGRVCAVAECDRPAKQRGWCPAHYKRWFETGQEPTGAIMGRREFVTYSGVHERMRRDFGSPSGYPCVECGKQADDWSYDNQDPDEILAPNGCYYSLDQDRYAPRCRQCHRRYDAAYGREMPWSPALIDTTRCLHGHEMDEANTYVRANGSVVCRACRAEGMRRKNREHAPA